MRRRESPSCRWCRARKACRPAAQDERIGAPFRLAGRHDIHMSGDDVAPTLARAYRDEDVGPVALGTRENRHLGSCCLTVVAYPIDDRVVWRANNRGKCDQRRKNFFHWSWRATLLAQFGRCDQRNHRQEFSLPNSAALWPKILKKCLQPAKPAGVSVQCCGKRDLLRSCNRRRDQKPCAQKTGARWQSG